MAIETIISHPVRTPLGAFGGSLRETAAVDLGAAAVRETLRRSGIDGELVGGVAMGNVIQAGNKMNPARQAAIHAGVPVNVPAMTVNRVCGSGAQAIVSIAQEVQLELYDVGIAGGMENMDRAPYALPDGRHGYRMGGGTIIDTMLHDGLTDAFSNEHSGWHTEDLAKRFAIGREAQDSWAERSQSRFVAAQGQGLFEAEIVPLMLAGKRGETRFDADEQPRPGTTVEGLAKLKPAFRENGTITAGNAPGLNSGASAMIVTSRRFADANDVAIAGRLTGYAVSSLEPHLFGIAPVPAVQAVLERCGWRLSQVERFEINEAFAAVPLAIMKELGLPQDVVNVEGGAIAHGHAIGATGAVLVTRLLHSMKRDGIRRGIVTLCIGGGQGIALALEVPS